MSPGLPGRPERASGGPWWPCALLLSPPWNSQTHECGLLFSASVAGPPRKPHFSGNHIFPTFFDTFSANGCPKRAPPGPPFGCALPPRSPPKAQKSRARTPLEAPRPPRAAEKPPKCCAHPPHSGRGSKNEILLPTRVWSTICRQSGCSPCGELTFEDAKSDPPGPQGGVGRVHRFLLHVPSNIDVF